MSDADSPNQEPSLPESVEPVEPVNAATAAPSSPPPNSQSFSEGWQTVSFPGAMSLDAIPASEAAAAAVPSEQASTELAAVIPLHQAASDRAAGDDMATVVQQLRQENADLRDRLQQLEQDLVQQQIEWQLAMVHTAYENDQPAPAPVADVTPAGQAFAATQEQVKQLFQELERSHQATQRQQILVETLTEQLESSQERIAQLERDCALTQQRYNEQVQQVMQVEHTCRDLRMRLHRQQQHTLQFKAALEKCLEMPTPYRQGHFMAPTEVDTSMPDGAASSASDLLAAKNQPVKPWSAPGSVVPPVVPGDAVVDRSQALFNLLHSAPEPTTPSDLAAPATPDWSTALDADDPEFVTNLMNLIFPGSSAIASPTSEATVAAETIFDLSPFLDAASEAIAAAQPSASSVDSVADAAVPDVAVLASSDEPLPAPADEPPTAPSNLLSLPPVTPTPDATQLWQDLASVIDANTENSGLALVPLDQGGTIDQTESAQAETTLAPLGDRPVLSTSPAPIPPLFESRRDSATPVGKASRSRQRPELATWTWQTGQLTTAKPSELTVIDRSSNEQPSQLVAVQADERSTIPATPLGQSLPTSWPSPIVYPLRPTKKLASLAAVDLPSFPRR